ncbi:metal ABC transporter solute-binding protein, Zn/Mn family [Nocardioides sp. CPCC 205120]|uniref:metal ABC transporter substrate-binding protein n=1 Tax=Nocardioides sp. CPCC 205120 TaxID=3406462 RepID=UPI003B511893
MPSSLRRSARRSTAARRGRAPGFAPLAAAVALPLVLAGCGALGVGDDDTAADGGSGGGVDDVVAAFYPLQYAAQRVVGDDVEVANLVEAGGEPHDLELSVEQTGRIADADLVLYLSGFQPSVDAAVEQSAPDTSLDVADSVALQAFAEGGHDHSEEEHAEDEHAEDEHAEEEGHTHSEDEHAEEEGHTHSEDEHAEEEGHTHSEDEHAEEEGHTHSEDEHAEEEGHTHSEDEHAEEEGHDHDHGSEDPHFWLDPLRLADAADTIAERLGELDPDRAEEFEANAADLRSDLEALDGEYTDGLASCERDLVVVNHDAFGYLTKYGLTFAPVVGLTPDAEPTPAALAELQGLIADEGITTVFSERLASPAAAESLASDTGLTTEVLDPIEGLTDQTADEDYLSLMRSNLAAITEANGC